MVLLIGAARDQEVGPADDGTHPDAFLLEPAAPAELVSAVTLLSRIARAERNRAQLAVAVAVSPPGIPTTALPDDSEFATALRASQALYSALTRSMPQIIYLSGPAGESLYINQYWFEYTGVSAEQSRGYGYLSAVHPDDAGAMEEKCQHCVAEARPFAMEYRLRAGDGRYRWHSTRSVPLFDDQGKTVAWVGVSIDIDDRKRQEHGEAVVSVRDTGIGIAAELLPGVFDLFMQAPDPSSGARDGGLGIGLTIVRRLVELHGGKVSAHSAGIRQGSEFVVRLPVATGTPSGEQVSAPGRQNRRTPAAGADRR